MKFTTRRAFIVLAVTAGFLALAAWSARIGKRVWSPKVFGWRNPFKPQPIIEKQLDCPLQLVRPRFYSFTSIGSAIGSVMKIDAKNVSDKPIHSFSVSLHSSDLLGNGSSGIQPEKPLQPGKIQIVGESSRGSDRVTVSVDFVQFADGNVWYADPPREVVKPKGVQAGEQAAINYLREVVKSDGAAAVIKVLPHIRMKISEPNFSTRENYGYFGFYCG